MLFGFFLGLVGASLDLYSAYQFMVGPSQNPMPAPAAGMLTIQFVGPGFLFGVGGAALGIFVLASAAASISAFGAAHMRAFGGLMIVYGLLMVLTGSSMGGMASAKGPESFLGFGMLLVGGLMAINGFMMLREAALSPNSM
ncbi:MAG: hypothetical protein JRM88_01105 [Nitrososphaerota archaeon]|nr:hypothetical protein [Nitrososphaerota archaeon]